MKQTIYILILASGLWSCNNQASEKAANTNSIDTLQTVPAEKQGKDIYIKDKSQYDQTFIDGLADYNEPIKLLDDYIVTGNDTTYFPSDLKLNTATIFKAAKGNRKYELTVTRINLTTLAYDFKLSDKSNKIVDSKSGKANLGSMFFLASENDEDSDTAEGYGSTQYWDKTTECWFSINVGIGKDDNGKQRAMLSYSCSDDKKQNLNLDGCPTLRTQ